jgi:hypothetical protein
MQLKEPLFGRQPCLPDVSTAAWISHPDRPSKAIPSQAHPCHRTILDLDLVPNPGPLPRWYAEGRFREQNPFGSETSKPKKNGPGESNHDAGEQQNAEHVSPDSASADCREGKEETRSSEAEEDSSQERLPVRPVDIFLPSEDGHNAPRSEDVLKEKTLPEGSPSLDIKDYVFLKSRRPFQ